MPVAGAAGMGQRVVHDIGDSNVVVGDAVDERRIGAVFQQATDQVR